VKRSVPPAEDGPRYEMVRIILEHATVAIAGDGHSTAYRPRNAPRRIWATRRLKGEKLSRLLLGLIVMSH
jgi:hypothetical protein